MTEKVMCPQCRLLFPEDDRALWGHKPLVGLVCPDCMVASLPKEDPTAQAVPVYPAKATHTWSTAHEERVRDALGWWDSTMATRKSQPIGPIPLGPLEERIRATLASPGYVGRGWSKPQPIPAEPTPLVKAWAVQAQVSGPGMPLGMIAWGVFAEDEARARAVFLDDARFEAKAQGMSEAQQRGLRVLITRVQHMPSWESFGMVTARVALMRAGGPKGKMGGAPKSL